MTDSTNESKSEVKLKNSKPTQMNPFNSDLIPIQKKIDALVLKQAYPHQDNTLDDYLHPSFEQILATEKAVHGTRHNKDEHKTFFSIQDSIDQMLISQPKQNKPSSFIDFLQLSSLLVHIIHFSELLGKRFPSFPMVSAVEVPISLAQSDLINPYDIVFTQMPLVSSPKIFSSAPSSDDFFGSTPYEMNFLLAIEKQNLPTVEEFLKKPAILKRINIPDKGGLPPLIRAAITGNLTVLEKLIEAGADIDAQTNAGDTALTFMASKVFSAPVLELLLRNQAFVFHKNRIGLRASELTDRLHQEYSSQPKDYQLAIHNSNTIIVNYEVFTTFVHNLWWENSTDQGLLNIFSQYTAENIKQMLGKPFLNKQTFLTSTIESGRTEIVKQLIEWRADVNFAINHQLGPLQRAILKSNVNMTKLLLSEGANPNPAVNNFSMPITIAIDRSKNPRIVEELIKYKANLNISIPLGDALEKGSLLELALMHSDLQIPAILIKNGLSPTILSFLPAIINNNFLAVKLLLDRTQVNINERFGQYKYKEFTPLLLAAHLKHADIYHILVEAGADVQASFHGTTAKQLAYRNKLIKDDKEIEKNPKGGDSKFIIAEIVLVFLTISLLYYFCFGRRKKNSSPPTAFVANTTRKNQHLKEKKSKSTRKPPHQKEIKKPKEFIETTQSITLKKEITFNKEEIEQQLEKIIEQSNLKKITASIYQDQLKEAMKELTNPSTNQLFQYRSAMENTTDSIRCLTDFHKEATSLKKDVNSENIESCLKLQSNFEQFSLNFSLQDAPSLRIENVKKSDRQNKYDIEKKTTKNEKPIVTLKEKKQSEKSNKNQFFTPSDYKTTYFKGPGKNQKLLHYQKKLELINVLISVFEEAEIFKVGEEKSKMPFDEIKYKKLGSNKKQTQILLKLAILFAILLTIETIKSYFSYQTSPHRNLKNIRNHIVHALSIPLNRKLADIVLASVEFFQKLRQVSSQNKFNEACLNNFESEMLNELIKTPTPDEMPAISAPEIDQYFKLFGERWSQLDTPKKSPQFIIHQLAINFLITPPDCLDKMNIYLEAASAEKIRRKGTSWRHNKGAEDYLHLLLQGFIPEIIPISEATHTVPFS